jgi:Fibronectin type III domain
VQRGRHRWRRLTAASVGVLSVALLCTSVGAVPGTSRTLSMPLPAGSATPPVVSYVSLACRTVGACTAVGSYSNAAGDLTPVADLQGAHGWEVPTTIALPAGAATQPAGFGLRSVACPTQGSCVAVGAYVTTAATSNVRPLVATQVSGVWGPASSTIPVPTGAKDATLDAIWCNTASSCVVAGSYTEGKSVASHVFVDERVGGAWQSPVALPDPMSPKLHGAVVVMPHAISCTSLAGCAIVGAVTGTPSYGLQYGWAAVGQGGTWTPWVFSPYSTFKDSLNAVSCPTPTQCLAVGTLGPTLTSTGKQAPFAVGYANGRWSSQWILPWSFWAPSLIAGSLSGVSCPTVRRCLAVGELDTTTAGTAFGAIGSYPAVYTRTDNVWTGPAFATTPASLGSVSAGAVLATITCPSKRYCETVGTTTPRKTSVSGVYPFSTVAQPFFRGTAPSAVTDISITRGHRRFQVRWEGPNRFGGSPIATYVVVARSPKELTIDCVTVTTTCRLYRVVPHHRYSVDVQALNSARRYGPIRRVFAVGV